MLESIQLHRNVRTERLLPEIYIYNVLYIEFLLVKCAFIAEILILGSSIDFL